MYMGFSYWEEELYVEELLEYIEHLMISEALEVSKIISDQGKEDLLIPYLMNDAVECVIHLKNVSYTGELEWMKYTSSIQGFSIGIVFQSDSHSLSIDYSEAILETHCYQYHLIGHNWRKDAGQEHIRRLVNLLCIIHDKYSYLGEMFCNSYEMDLYPLINFEPLCYWTPINEPIISWYPESEEGIQAMKALVEEAGDDTYYDFLCQYEESHDLIIKKRLTDMLCESEHAAIYQLLIDKLFLASSIWDKRDYGKVENDKIRNRREAITISYQESGFTGIYPEFIKKYPNGRVEQIRIMEEHPFTVMDWESYSFKVFALHSHYEKGDFYFEKITDYGFFQQQNNLSIHDSKLIVL